MLYVLSWLDGMEQDSPIWKRPCQYPGCGETFSKSRKYNFARHLERHISHAYHYTEKELAPLISDYKSFGVKYASSINAPSMAQGECRSRIVSAEV